jgi:glycosyltransferase involved in cell wall biosynthesis
MNLYFVEKFSEGDLDLQLEAMRKYMVFTELHQADAIFCGSVAKMHKAMTARNESGKPLVVYCWDYYLWAHEGRRREGNAWHWPTYAKFMQGADLVLVPSRGQALRLKELLNIDAVVVKTGIKRWDEYYDLDVKDSDFILDPLRYYDADENHKWADLAAEKLSIPIIHSEHQYGDEEFGRLIASCSFMTSCVQEASTGALTLAEGLWLGKTSLVSNSPFMGARDYLGDFGHYFQYDDFDDLVLKMKHMWDERPIVNKVRAREWMDRELTFDTMAKNIYENIYRILPTNR